MRITILLVLATLYAVAAPASDLKPIGSEVTIRKAVPACRSLGELREVMAFHRQGNTQGIAQLEKAYRCVALKVGVTASLIERPETFIVRLRFYDPDGGAGSVELFTFKEAIE